MPSSSGGRSLVGPRSAAWSSAAVFLANGLGAGGFFSRLPEQQRRFDLTDAELGITVVGLAAGALASSPIAGRAVGSRGSRQVVTASAVLLGGTWWMAGAAPSAATLFLALLVIGAADAAMDISMNANAAAHERQLGRSRLHLLHALWSVGMLIGAATGSVAAAAGIGLTPHLAFLGAAVVLTVASVRRSLPDDGRSAAAGDRVRTLASRTSVRLLAAMALASAAAAIVEGSATDWSAIQLERLGTGPGVAALGPAAFMAGMVAGRLAGDRLTDRFGGDRLLRTGGLVVAAGVAGGVATGHPAVFACGIALAGAGASVFFPLAFSASARTPGVSPGAGAATVSLGGRVGFITEPVLVGLVSDATSLRWALAGVAAVAALLASAGPGLLPGVRSEAR